MVQAWAEAPNRRESEPYLAATLPWALRIDPANRPADTPDVATYHPTFLYESLWCLGVFVLLIWAEKRFRLDGGRLFALYVAAYTVGRVWIEALRVDHANRILGVRLNVWTSIIIFTAAVALLILGRRGQPEPAASAIPDEPADETVNRQAQQ